jgi:RNA 2',3'-cyclic 3'-phosphodiesterase
MRVFLAVPPDPAWVERARALVERVRREAPSASWTRPESWHLTLKFLGEVSEETAEAFGRALDPPLGAAVPGSLVYAGALLLPGRNRPRVLGAGFAEGSGGLAALADIAAAAEAASRRLGGEPETRTFRPHVTFARVRAPWPREAVDRYAREADGWSFPEWPVRRCVLYKSRLAPTGAVHTPLREWTMASRAAELRA